MMTALTQSFRRLLAGPNGNHERLERFAEAGSRYSDFLPGTLAITEQPPPLFAKSLIYISGAFLFTLVLWSSASAADRIITAQGKVRPAGQVQVINHPTGGVIDIILVRAGDRVVQGQNLVRFDPLIVAEELQKAQTEYNTIRAEIARLEAEESGDETAFFPEELTHEAPDAVATQRSLFKERAVAKRQRLLAMSGVIEQREATVNQYEARTKNTREALEVGQRQEKAINALAAKQYYPKLRALQMEREVMMLRNDFEQSGAMVTTARAAVGEAKAQLAQAAGEWRAEVLQALTEKRARAAQLKGTLVQLDERRQNLNVTAPVAGFVERVQVTTTGQTVSPGQELMHIVPQDRNYIIDVSVPNRDIGLLREGMPVTLKFHAFDYQRYGTISGKVSVVATDSAPRAQDGELFFSVQVTPDVTHLPNNSVLRIHSGMVADADFHVGTRTVLSYVLDAVVRERDEAFRE